MEIKVMKNVLDRNRDMAARVREILSSHGIRMINMISSPGSGKTSLLEIICEKLAGDIRMAIIEGDVATDRDAQRLKKYDVPIVLINTGGGCHLDSNSIDHCSRRNSTWTAWMSFSWRMWAILYALPTSTLVRISSLHL
jgi:hydrogenase nickel incorporation protein HypB